MSETYPSVLSGAVDLMIGFPDPRIPQRELNVQYLFKKAPEDLGETSDPVAVTLGEMDRCGVAIGMVGIGEIPGSEVAERAVREHPTRFVAWLEIDPNDIGGTVRRIRKAKDEFDIKAVGSFPARCNPQVPVSDRRYYPIYQTCVDLDIPMILNAGVPGPRLPGACQTVMHFDDVCYDFPDLRLVMRHGAEPEQALAVKLMLKWPGLHYMTSAYAPKYYPKEIVDYANSRGADKVMYAGYYPMGLSLQRIFSELSEVPFRDEVRPMFLRTNAMRVFKLGQQ